MKVSLLAIKFNIKKFNSQLMSCTSVSNSLLFFIESCSVKLQE